MAIIIGCVSQKGGVGKSTMNRLLAREFIVGGFSAKIIDLDKGQNTCYAWSLDRNKSDIQPYIPVQQYPRLDKALEMESNNFDVLLIDGAPNSDRETLKIAQACNLIIVPTGISKDDTDPTKKLINELIAKGIPADRITIALTKVLSSGKAGIAETYHKLISEGFDVLEGGMRAQPGYINAFDAGKAATETSFKTLNEEAEKIGNCVVERLKKLQQQGRAA